MSIDSERFYYVRLLTYYASHSNCFQFIFEHAIIHIKRARLSIDYMVSQYFNNVLAGSWTAAVESIIFKDSSSALMNDCVFNLTAQFRFFSKKLELLNRVYSNIYNILLPNLQHSPA